MSLCDNCIHDDVCGVEDNHDDSLILCDDMIPKTHWIPTSERLPEEGQSILVTTTNGWYVVAIIRTFFKDMHKDIIAWMPLPEPYKAESEGKE